jgi:hypothetical protein
MQRYWRAIPLAACVLVAALVVLVLMTRDGGSATSGATTLPTACENFAQASELFARGGAGQSVNMTGGQVFTRDPDVDAKQILMDLMQSCDAERSGR